MLRAYRGSGKYKLYSLWLIWSQPNSTIYRTGSNHYNLAGSQFVSVYVHCYFNNRKNESACKLLLQNVLMGNQSKGLEKLDIMYYNLEIA